MNELGGNPLVPTFWDIFLSAGALGLLAFFVVAVIDILRKILQGGVSRSRGVVALLLILLLPLIGPLAWFYVIKRQRRANTAVLPEI